MRVDDLGKLQAVQDAVETSKNRKQVKDDAFTRLLASEMNSESASGVTGSEEAGSIDPLACVRLTGQFPVADNAGLAALSGVDTGLKGLEGIVNALSDESVGPKEVDAMMQALPQSVEEVQKSIADLPEEHPLKEIGNEISVTAYVESVKWRRGDYL